MNPRVVITGMGTINPLADNLEAYYENLLAGKSGIKRWESIDLSRVECKVGGDLGDYDCLSALSGYEHELDRAAANTGTASGGSTYKQAKKLFRSATFSGRTAALSALDAYSHCGLLGSDAHDRLNTSVVVAGHNLNSNYIFRNALQFQEEPEYIDPLSGVEAIDPNVPALVTEILGIEGPTMTIGGACASGNLALREAVRDITTGECNRSVVCGAVFDVAPPDIQASAILNSVVVAPKYQDNPERASRPFDADRGGFIYSHGTATLIIESLESALARGATIHAEVLGVKANANANHLPMPGAEKQSRVMEQLLAAAGVAPTDVTYANCHATGTPSGDLQEIRAIKRAFGDHAYDMKLNAPKSMLGHTCWASPLVETIGGILQMNHGTLHPSINIDMLDPEVDLDVCAGRTVDCDVRYMLKNSFGFGGVNCCSLIGRYDG